MNTPSQPAANHKPESSNHPADVTAGWHIHVLDEHFNQRNVSFNDRTVTGQQIAHQAGFRQTDGVIVLQQLKGGGMEEIRLEELVDPKEAGVERFFVMVSDRTFRLIVDGLRLEWPRAQLTGEAIRKLADRDEHYEVVQVLADAPDTFVEADEVVSLTGNGTEKFKTRRAERLITVFYGEHPYEMPRRSYTTEQLRQEFKVEEGYTLDQIGADGSFNELKPGQEIHLKNGMKFASYVPCGQSS